MKSAKILEVLILTLPFNKRTEINCGLQGMIFISISIHIHPFTLIHTNISGQNIKKSTLIFFLVQTSVFLYLNTRKVWIQQMFFTGTSFIMLASQWGQVAGRSQLMLVYQFQNYLKCSSGPEKTLTKLVWLVWFKVFSVYSLFSIFGAKFMAK